MTNNRFRDAVDRLLARHGYSLVTAPAELLARALSEVQARLAGADGARPAPAS